MSTRAFAAAVIALLPLAASADDATGAVKPVAVNLVPKAAGAAYDKIRETFGKFYAIVDIAPEDPAFTPPKLLNLSQRLSAEGEQSPAGEARVVYLIAADGTVLLPALVEATTPSMGASLLESVARSRFSPARYQGKPVTAIGGQQIEVRPHRPGQ